MKPFTVRTNVNNVPAYDIETYKRQQLPDISPFSSFKQVIESGGLNAGSRYSRTFSIKKKTHLTFFHWSIKGKPDSLPEIQLYSNINGVLKQIIRHCMPAFPWGIGQAVTDEEYQDRTYNFVPPIVLLPVTENDELIVSVDGGADGNFCVVYYEEPY